VSPFTVTVTPGRPLSVKTVRTENGDVGFQLDAVSELDLACGEYAAGEYALDFQLYADRDVACDAALKKSSRW